MTTTRFQKLSKMAENGRSERQGLGKFVKSQSKYGSTSKLMLSNESYIKHFVKPGETWQGICLKYGTTVRLWKQLLQGLFQKYETFKENKLNVLI